MKMKNAREVVKVCGDHDLRMVVFDGLVGEGDEIFDLIYDCDP